LSLYQNSKKDASSRFEINIGIIIKENDTFDSSIIFDGSFMQSHFVQILKQDESMPEI